MDTFYWWILLLCLTGLGVFVAYSAYKFIEIRKQYQSYMFYEEEEQTHNLKKEYTKYLASVHPTMYRIKLPPNTKLPKYNTKHFTRTYLEHVRPIKPSEYKSLSARINDANEIIKSYKLDKIKKIPWKFLISHRELELGFPYTIADYIVIPEDMLETISVETLLHEKIHIYQRKYPQICKTIYESILPFAHQIDSSIIQIPEEILETKMTNPDENGEVWLYHYKGRWYYPSLQMGLRQRTEQIGYEVDVSQRPMKIVPYKTITLKKMSTFDAYSSHISVYHPHEIFACILAHHLISGQKINKGLENHLNMSYL